MTKKLSKKEKERIIIILLKCIIVLMAIDLIICLYLGYQYDFGPIDEKRIWEKKLAICFILLWIFIIVYLVIGSFVKDLKKKLK